jgi:hypothetical protein
MPTKTSTPKQAPKTATVPISRTVQPKPENVHSSGQIPPAFISVADEVASLLFYGDDKELAEQVIRAAATHKLRRRFPTPDKSIPKWAEDQAKLWIDEFLAAWHDNRRKETPDYPASSAKVSERIRAVTWATLYREFDNFMQDAISEERQLLLEVLILHANTNVSYENELPLAAEFEYQVSARLQAFIRCPEDLQNQVQDYIKCLVAARPCSKAAV